MRVSLEGAHAPIVLSDVRYAVADGTTVRTVLDGVDLVVEPGELVAVTGPSGSGKTTLLSIVAGLLRPTSGWAVTGGHVVSLAERTRELAGLRRSTLGVVEQVDDLLPGLSVADNVGLPLELAGERRDDIDRAVAAALAGVGLADRRASAVDALSGGERQRVAIARSLVGRRSILVADEPTSALDRVAGEEVMRLLRSIATTDGVAVLMSTHDPSHAAWADRVLRLDDGRLVG